MLHSIPATGIFILNQIHILHASLIESTKTVAWVPLFNALLETVEWWWLSQIFMDWGPNFASCSWYPFYTKLLVLLCMHSRTWPLLRLWEALSHNLKILVIIAANIPILTYKISVTKCWRFLVWRIPTNFSFLSNWKKLSIYHFIQCIKSFLKIC